MVHAPAIRIIQLADDNELRRVTSLLIQRPPDVVVVTTGIGFRGWIEDPGRTGSAFTGIAMDFRPVTGPLDAHLALDEIIRSAREHHEFIRHLGAHAVSTRPPKGLLKDGVVQGRGTTGRLDIKAVGIGLITNVARLLAVMSGLTENRTPLRLRDTTALGWLSADESQGLVEALELMWQVRLEHQSRCIERGMDHARGLHLVGTVAEGHGAETDLRDFQAAAAETAIVHAFSPRAILSVAKDDS